jgi:hypothetical protein
MDDVSETFAEFHSRLGGIPLDRIWMTPPPGTAIFSPHGQLHLIVAPNSLTARLSRNSVAFGAA